MLKIDSAIVRGFDVHLEHAAVAVREKWTVENALLILATRLPTVNK